MSSPGNKNKYDWIIVLSGLIFFATIFSFSAPSSLQPRATYIGCSLNLLLILNMIFWYLMKKCRKSAPLAAPEDLSEIQINSIETIENTYDRHQTNGSQISLTTSETSLPPKYEMPPSYSQAVSTLTLHYWSINSGDRYHNSKGELGRTCCPKNWRKTHKHHLKPSITVLLS